MSKKIQVKQGDKYGRLTIVCELAPYADPSGDKLRIFSCRCECGEIAIARLGHIRSGHTTSCGCLRKEKILEQSVNNMTHGHSKTCEYKTWLGMIGRCYNPNASNFQYYGGAGVVVCDSWRNSFLLFFEDMGKKPTLKHSIERLDNKKGYSPGNCIWATVLEQNRNRSNVSLSLKKAAEIRFRYKNSDNLTHSKLASEYGVTRQNIGKVIGNNIWVKQGERGE